MILKVFVNLEGIVISGASAISCGEEFCVFKIIVSVLKGPVLVETQVGLKNILRIRQFREGEYSILADGFVSL